VQVARQALKISQHLKARGPQAAVAHDGNGFVDPAVVLHQVSR
jgi:hypothetical protein